MSQYISFPYQFELPLSKRKFYQFKKKIIKNFSLKKIVDSEINHLDFENFKENFKKSDSVAEKILSIFLNKDLLLGPKENIYNNRKSYLNKLNFFIKEQKPILFRITQIAFKIPNPLKTTRTTPDLGELAFLSQFNDILQIVKKIYPPGAKLIILGESYVFYQIVGIKKSESSLYFNTIKKWLKELNWQNDIILTDLKKLEKKVKGFKEEYKKNLKSLYEGWSKKDKFTINEIKSIANTLYLSINTRKYSLEKLMDIYDSTKESGELKTIRDYLYNKAIKQSFPYLAYHKTIETSNLGEMLFPNSLKLSCTYSSGALSIFTINKSNKLYPYHGRPLLLNKQVKICYEIDLKRKPSIVAHYINKEKNPFFFTLEK